MSPYYYQYGNNVNKILLPYRCIYLLGNIPSNAGMLGITEINRRNLSIIIEEHHGGSQTRFADAMGFKNPSLVSRYLSTNPKTAKAIGKKLARRIEKTHGKAEFWMDQDHHQVHEPHASYNAAAGPEIRGEVPLISWVQAGSWSIIVDNNHPGDAEEWVKTTVPLHRHTYALRVKGDSMTNPNGEPTFPHGQIIIVEPDAIDTPDKLVGSLVIVRRNGDDEATFKQLVRDGSKFFLKPLNPQYPMLELKETDEFCGVVREKTVRYF